MASRRIAISGSMNVVDHESFGSNETGFFTFSDSKILDDIDQPEQVIYTEGRVGDEVRVELRINAQLSLNNRIRIKGTAKLFEGTSEDSDDLDGYQEFGFTVPRNQRISQTVRLRNTDEGGDYANISFTAANRRN